MLLSRKTKSLSVRLSLILLALLCTVGCQMMMYPVARAFGGAKESELKICRQAFMEMKTDIHSSSVVVFTPLVSNLKGKPVWDADAVKSAVELLRRELSPSVISTTEIPDIPFEPMGHNQLRYENKRAHHYAAWVSSHHPAGDRFLFTEIVRDETGATILGGQIYIVDAAGRIAYSRHYNSHWFDPASMPSVDAFVKWMLNSFIKDLEKDPLEIFPRYGVG